MFSCEDLAFLETAVAKGLNPLYFDILCDLCIDLDAAKDRFSVGINRLFFSLIPPPTSTKNS